MPHLQSDAVLEDAVGVIHGYITCITPLVSDVLTHLNCTSGSGARLVRREATRSRCQTTRETPTFACPAPQGPAKPPVRH